MEKKVSSAKVLLTRKDYTRDVLENRTGESASMLQLPSNAYCVDKIVELIRTIYMIPDLVHPLGINGLQARSVMHQIPSMVGLGPKEISSPSQ